jgi:hypothetical protein
MFNLIEQLKSVLPNSYTHHLLTAKIVIDGDTFINDVFSWVVSNGVWIIAVVLFIRLVFSIKVNEDPLSSDLPITYNNFENQSAAILQLPSVIQSVIPEEKLISLKNQKKAKVLIKDLDKKFD